MGLFDNLIKRGVNRAVGNAVGRGIERGVERSVERAVAPKIEKAAEGLVNKAADQIIKEEPTSGATVRETPATSTAADSESMNQAAGVLGSLFGSMALSANNIANEAAKSIKICESCGQAAGANVKFCPSCGAKLPEKTVAQGAVCPSCGKQNGIGMKFCQECGTRITAQAE